MKEPNLFSTIKSDHQKLEQIATALTHESEGPVRSALYAQLRRQLTAHSDAEERSLYVRLGHFEALEKRLAIKDLLQKLDNTPVEHKNWAPQMNRLQEILLHHIHEEEQELFLRLQKTFTESELRDLNEAFIYEKKDFAERVRDMLFGRVQGHHRAVASR